MIGKTISYYKIVKKLGQGGMGVVYLAEDTRLNRLVALKFLPAQQLASPEDNLRFEQEAKAAAQLSHANIATVFEINEHEGQTFIAMEYIEGETLAEKVRDRPLKFKDAIKIASQVAAGLHVAHEQGIVHRDIKSTNIMLTSHSRGRPAVVKITDFGLAKMSQASLQTETGTTLGTISHMSPEQAAGESVDHRSDIWSLGVVLYEMISGKLPFKGDYDPAIVFSILNEEPEPLTALRTGVPIDLERIVNKLLAKDPDNRYQNIIELPVDLKNVSFQDVSNTETGSSGLSQQKELNVKVTYSYRTLLTVVATAVLTSLLIWIFTLGPPPPRHRSVNKLAIQLPENLRVQYTNRNRITISPDGSNIAFIGMLDSDWGLFTKKASSFGIEKMARIGHIAAPFFSRDGKWIGYFAQDGFLYKVLAAGGEPLRVTPVEPNHNGATWAPENTIIYGAVGGLMRVSAAGGEAGRLTGANHPKENHWFPHMLPDAETVIFSVHRRDMKLSDARLASYRFGDDSYRILLDEEGYNPVYSSTGHILYGRANQLMAVPFDLESLQIAGTPVPVLENVQTNGIWGGMSYALSEEGTIVYVTGAEFVDQRRAKSVDMAGNSTELFDLNGTWALARISPDGSSVALHIEENGVENIWIYDVAGGAIKQLTFYTGSHIGWFAWSPDNRNLAYATAAGDSSYSIYIQSSDGTGQIKKIYTFPSAGITNISDWSSDGDKLLVFHASPGSNWDIFIYSFRDSSMMPFLTTPALEVEPVFSPNGKWIAYSATSYSGEVGGFDVYVRSSSRTANGIWKISSGQGNQPAWSPNGDKIYFRCGNQMFAADVTTSGDFSRRPPRELFKGNFFLERGRRWDVWPDGQGFLVIQNPWNEPRDLKINVIQGFANELIRLAPLE